MSTGLKSYVVVGAGMQGTAAAYDIARFGDSNRLVLADADGERARASAQRVNRLVGFELCQARQVDASDPEHVARLVAGADVVLSCVPYKLHLTVEEGCFAAGVSVIDMGNDTDVTLETLTRSDELAAKGITFVPDTGLAPGLVNSIATMLMADLDETDSIRLFCGGLPQNPKPPFNYSLRFSVEGLVGEYVDVAIVTREHEVLRLDTLDELETIEVPQIGLLEAFTTSSGTSTAPYTFKDRVRNYEYKTLRYPGHCEYMRVFRKYGFWEEEPIMVDGKPVNPLHFFCALMGDQLADPTDKDLVVVHAIARGMKAGRDVELVASIVDFQDDETGFTSMERLTGFSTAIMAIEVAHGRVAKGAVRYELAVPGKRVVDELARRGISITVTETTM